VYGIRADVSSTAVSPISAAFTGRSALTAERRAMGSDVRISLCVALLYKWISLMEENNARSPFRKPQNVSTPARDQCGQVESIDG
jgi:hypothetical protein